MAACKAQDMRLLWGAGSPPCWRVMIVLEEKQLQGYDQKLLSFVKMEHKSEEVMAMNPRGQLPCFKVKDYILNESYAACLFLENQFKSQGTKLIPDCAAEQAKMYQLMFEGLTLLQKIADVIYYDWKVPENERHEAAIKRNQDALKEEAKLWEKHLEKGCEFLAGKSFSLADACVYPIIAYVFHYGLCEERYPNMARYCKGLKDRPSIKATCPPTWFPNPRANELLRDV